jgi:hypothetical protein
VIRIPVEFRVDEPWPNDNFNETRAFWHVRFWCHARRAFKQNIRVVYN